eukprot:Sspe_Gene.53156::Locus_29407_Transcript_1_1_Confidence_1.000_Length_1348::g.53156::m.53156/K00052/leuB, IMDH; 3-isopropylmalate dehydrogenase
MAIRGSWIAVRGYATAVNKRIVVLPGDGVGPEVAEQAVKVMKSVQGKDLSFTFESHLIGGAALDATGNNALPDFTLNACRKSDAILLGAVGGPKWDKRKPTEGKPEQGLLKIRKELGLFANLRPILSFEALEGVSPLRADIAKGVSILFVRELTGGLYFGKREEENADGVAIDTLPYSVPEVERIVRVAARAAMGRKRKLLSVDKANVLATSRLWRRVATEVVEKEFPEVELRHGLVDSVAMDIIRSPSSMDVVVTENLFGDILSDEGSVLAGSLGLLPSASLGEPGTPGLYEPIHGSAPDIAGQGKANPIAAILSAAMMMEHSLGFPDKARAIEKAVHATLAKGLRTADIARPGDKKVGTDDMGSAIAEEAARAIAA